MPQSAAPDLAFVFRRPFSEQVAFFRGKLGNLVPTATWRDIMRSQHDRAFMVAGAAKADLLADLAAAVDKAIAEGESLQAFRKRFGQIVQKNGWHGWTGEGTKAGTNWRTRVIYRTNMATSYAAGRLAQLQNFPLWVYRHSGAEHPRLQHKAWDGMVLPADHEFWKTHFPPNGWGCGCRVAGASSANAARRLGGDPGYDAPPAGWDARDAKGRMPGIDEGWDYMPGRKAQAIGRIARALARDDPVMADLAATFAPKTVAWPYELAKAYMAGVPAQMRDALAIAQRSLAETGEAVRRYAARVLTDGPQAVEPYRTMGLLTQDEARQIARLTGVEAVAKELYDWAIERSSPLHIRDKHGDDAAEALRGQTAVTVDDYALLPQIIAGAARLDYGGLSDIGRPVVLVVKTVEGVEYEAAFEVLPRRRMLALKSMRKRGRPPILRP
ncbi:phage minor head protein [Azohydromonas sediminis]|uniref:phage minor head protein n=1 Tax=Azohydromonas sediminis TaxID=2259674 RepID=UPI000E65919A|nr:phage minor head protein [Azohydromonas sediminis]